MAVEFGPLGADIASRGSVDGDFMPQMTTGKDGLLFRILCGVHRSCIPVLVRRGLALHASPGHRHLFALYALGVPGQEACSRRRDLKGDACKSHALATGPAHTLRAACF